MKLKLLPADAHAAEDALRLFAAELPDSDHRQALLRVARWLEAIESEVIGVLVP